MSDNDNVLKFPSRYIEDDEKDSEESAAAILSVPMSELLRYALAQPDETHTTGMVLEDLEGNQVTFFIAYGVDEQAEAIREVLSLNMEVPASVIYDPFDLSPTKH